MPAGHSRWRMPRSAQRTPGRARARCEKCRSQPNVSCDAKVSPIALKCAPFSSPSPTPKKKRTAMSMPTETARPVRPVNSDQISSAMTSMRFRAEAIGKHAAGNLHERVAGRERCQDVAERLRRHIQRFHHRRPGDRDVRAVEIGDEEGGPQQAEDQPLLGRGCAHLTALERAGKLPSGARPAGDSRERMAGWANARTSPGRKPTWPVLAAPGSRLRRQLSGTERRRPTRRPRRLTRAQDDYRVALTGSLGMYSPA